MKLEQTPAGLTAELRATGVGRFFPAAFLVVWLSFWAMGESFVLMILGKGLWALLTDTPFGPGNGTWGLGVALPVGLFLIVWLTFWTLGGVLAGNELLRLLFGRDRIIASSDGIEVVHSCGFFRSRFKAGRADIRRFFRHPSGTTLSVETLNGSQELTRFGAPAERAQLEEALNGLFHLQAQAAAEGALPNGWREIIAPERYPVLIPDPVLRRKRATVMWAICAPVSLGAVWLDLAALTSPGLWPAALIVTLLAAAGAWGAAWLSLGRHEWKLGTGRLVLQRRFGLNAKRLFEAVSLELTEEQSDDDGPWYELKGVAASARQPAGQCHPAKRTRIIHRKSDDPTEPRRFGVWLGQRCQIPLADLIAAEAKTKEFEATMKKLAASGRFGRSAARLLERAAAGRRPKG